MARTLNQVIATLPVKRRAKIERRAGELATLKDLRQAVEQTQEELATSLGVGRTPSRALRDTAICCFRQFVVTSRQWEANWNWSQNFLIIRVRSSTNSQRLGKSRLHRRKANPRIAPSRANHVSGKAVTACSKSRPCGNPGGKPAPLLDV